MKKLTFIALGLLTLNAFSQEHFSSITTSKRVGILNGHLNPSEYVNLKSKFEVQIFTFSVNMSNNRVSFSDLIKGENIENLLFEGKNKINLDINTAIFGPSFAVRQGKWGFGISTKAFIKASIIDLNPDLGNALINDEINSATGIDNIFSSDNQRVNSTTWGEMAFSVARTVIQTDKHQINAGLTVKLLFPGSYANLGLNNFQGDLRQGANGMELSNANSTLNIAYSGSFGSSFGETSDYFKSLFGGLDGMATDIGVDYQWLNDSKSYKLKVGASVRNMGSMTFSGDDNVSQNYALNIPNDQSLNLNEFNDANGIKDIKEVLDNSGFFTSTNVNEKFKVKLPTVFNFYADYKIIPQVSITAFLQQKMGDQDSNNQISTQNMFIITPRATFGPFEAFLPIGNNEISGGTLGLGFRVGGFFLGSNSILSAVTSDSQQADAYFGFRFGFL